MSDTVLVRSRLSGSRMRISADEWNQLVAEGKAADPPRQPEKTINGVQHQIAMEQDQSCEGDSLDVARQKRKEAQAANA